MQITFWSAMPWDTVCTRSIHHIRCSAAITSHTICLPGTARMSIILLRVQDRSERSVLYIVLLCIICLIPIHIPMPYSCVIIFSPPYIIVFITSSTCPCSYPFPQYSIPYRTRHLLQDRRCHQLPGQREPRTVRADQVHDRGWWRHLLPAWSGWLKCVYVYMYMCVYAYINILIWVYVFICTICVCVSKGVVILYSCHHHTAL